MRKYVLTYLFLLAVATGIQAQEISPWLFGQNHWMAQRDEGSRPGYLHLLWPKVEESGIKMVRIGGGGYNRRFPSLEQLGDMVDSIHGIGAEPILQVPSRYTAKQTRELVRYFNHSTRRRVEFWSIGNEPLLRNRDAIDEVHTYLVRIAGALKEADPGIKVFVFDECSLFEADYQALCGGRLDITGKDEKGNWIVDGFTFHRYPNVSADFDRDDVVFGGPQDIRGQIEALLAMMELANRQHGRKGEDRLMWGLTEVNVTTSNPDREIGGIGNTSFLGGQFMAEIYGLGMEYGAFTVAPWCINETDRISTDFGYLGLPSEFHPRSSYYHTQLMARHMKGEFLPTSSSNSVVRTVGTMDEERVCLLVMNRDPVHGFRLDIQLGEARLSGKAVCIRADMGLDRILEDSIPDQTTLLYILSKEGDILQKYTYGLGHNLKYLAPEMDQALEP